MFKSENVDCGHPGMGPSTAHIQSSGSYLPTVQMCSQPEPTSTPCRAQIQPCRPPCSLTASAITQHTQQSENQLLTRMMEMMEQLMGRVQSRETSNPTHGPRQQRSFVRNACRVCNDNKHTTVKHCMMDKLCFACLSPGHTKKECPKHFSAQAQQEGN